MTHHSYLLTDLLRYLKCLAFTVYPFWNNKCQHIFGTVATKPRWGLELIPAVMQREAEYILDRLPVTGLTHRVRQPHALTKAKRQRYDTIRKDYWLYEAKTVQGLGMNIEDEETIWSEGSWDDFWKKRNSSDPPQIIFDNYHVSVFNLALKSCFHLIITESD